MRGLLSKWLDVENAPRGAARPMNVHVPHREQAQCASVAGRPLAPEKDNKREGKNDPDCRPLPLMPF
jgi:hypothetical protein